jgi:hypothetical protein
MNEPPIISEPMPSSPARRRSRWIAAGFGTGVLFWAMPFVPTPDQAGVLWLLFDFFAAPIIAVALAIVVRTRPFGLGLLLACGFGWLVLLCICGGVFPMPGQVH